jgi:Trypsin-co-occurring domain 2
MQIPISDAIQQLRDELRKAILEGKDQDIIFTPNGIDIELGVTFETEAKAGGGFKVLALLDISAEARVNRESQHKIKLSLSVTDRNLKPLKVRAGSLPQDLPK